MLDDFNVLQVSATTRYGCHTVAHHIYIPNDLLDKVLKVVDDVEWGFYELEGKHSYTQGTSSVLKGQKALFALCDPMSDMFYILERLAEVLPEEDIKTMEHSNKTILKEIERKEVILKVVTYNRVEYREERVC